MSGYSSLPADKAWIRGRGGELLVIRKVGENPNARITAHCGMPGSPLLRAPGALGQKYLRWCDLEITIPGRKPYYLEVKTKMEPWPFHAAKDELRHGLERIKMFDYLIAETENPYRETSRIVVVEIKSRQIIAASVAKLWKHRISGVGGGNRMIYFRRDLFVPWKTFTPTEWDECVRLATQEHRVMERMRRRDDLKEEAALGPPFTC